jgi:hypothetical protein
MRGRLTALAAIIAAFAFASGASAARAAEKALWHGDDYNGIVRTISGVPDLVLDMEDDPNEWVYVLGASPSTLGFVCLYVYPGHWCYHRVFIAPRMSAALGLQAGGVLVPWWDTLGSNPAPSRDTVFALITFIHEAYHWKLYSSDESRVEACAIRDLPYWLDNQFRVPRTVQQTQTVPQVVTKQVPQVVTKRVKKPTGHYVNKRVKRKGKWVWVWVWVQTYRWVTVQETVYVDVQETVYVQQTVSVPNPVYTGVVNAANAYHASEAPPYGGGTC